MNLGTIFKVCYNPNISDTFIKKIRQISPSMLSVDETSAQYSVDIIKEHIEEEFLEKADRDFISYCTNENIDYIEI